MLVAHLKDVPQFPVWSCRPAALDVAVSSRRRHNRQSSRAVPVRRFSRASGSRTYIPGTSAPRRRAAASCRRRGAVVIRWIRRAREPARLSPSSVIRAMFGFQLAGDRGATVPEQRPPKHVDRVQSRALLDERQRRHLRRGIPTMPSSRGSPTPLLSRSATAAVARASSAYRSALWVQLVRQCAARQPAQGLERFRRRAVRGRELSGGQPGAGQSHHEREMREPRSTHALLLALLAHAACQRVLGGRAGALLRARRRETPRKADGQAAIEHVPVPLRDGVHQRPEHVERLFHGPRERCTAFQASTCCSRMI